MFSNTGSACPPSPPACLPALTLSLPIPSLSPCLPALPHSLPRACPPLSLPALPLSLPAWLLLSFFLSRGGSRNFGKGACPHANAEGTEKNEKFFFAPKLRKKWKSECQLSVFLASGTKIQGLIVSWQIFFEIQLNTSDGSTEVYDQTRSTWSSIPVWSRRRYYVRASTKTMWKVS